MRFEFQRSVVENTTGLVLNIGCNTDPAMLKGAFGDRVINCDIAVSDPSTPSFEVDSVFDCTVDRWPFEDDTIELVVFGDVIEHFYPTEFAHALAEARRVAYSICITAPEDPRVLDNDYWCKIKGTQKGLVHVQYVTRDYINRYLSHAGWESTLFETVPYGFVPQGHHVVAKRSPIFGKNKSKRGLVRSALNE